MHATMIGVTRLGPVLALFMVNLAVPSAGAAERPNDKEVKQLLERVDHDRDRFEDQLDGKLKRSIIRGAGGEVHVERYLDDLQANVDKLKDRFSQQYAASAEATAVLRQGADIKRFMASQPADLDGMSEWNRLAAGLEALAAAYGTTFPIPDGQQARRLNDAEVKDAAKAVAQNASRFRTELKNSLNQKVDKPTVDAAVKQVDDLKRAAERLASTIDSGRPASGEAQAVLQQGAAIRAAAAARPLSPAGKATWGEIEEHLTTVALGFGLPRQLP